MSRLIAKLVRRGVNDYVIGPVDTIDVGALDLQSVFGRRRR